MPSSVIVTTYNHPGWLRLSLLGFATQLRDDFEVIVADDGSDEKTRAVIAWARRELKLDLQHVWQPDRGFRKCRILNRAIAQARGSYLIFTDGDCIPRSDFIDAHLRVARPGHFLSGGYVKLPGQVSDAISDEDVRSGRCSQRSWLVARGYPRLKNLSKLTARGAVARFLDRHSTTRAGWHGHNASCWKADAVRVNGFDERMGWGGEDREFGDRLVNAGVRPIRIRYSAICVHLDHDRPWRDLAVLARNDALRAASRSDGVVETPCGIRQLPSRADRTASNEAEDEPVWFCSRSLPDVGCGDGRRVGDG